MFLKMKYGLFTNMLHGIFDPLLRTNKINVLQQKRLHEKHESRFCFVRVNQSFLNVLKNSLALLPPE